MLVIFNLTILVVNNFRPNAKKNYILDRIRVYVLEDEFITQELIKQTLEKFNYNLVGISSNAETALKEITELEPDVLLLDINVDGEKSGIWLAELVPDYPKIFFTAYNDIETIKEATKHKPISYLLKPYNEMQLIASVQLAVGLMNENKPEKDNGYKVIVLKDGHKYHKIDLSTVLYIKSDANYIHVFQKNDKQFMLRSSLGNFHNLCPQELFIRIHRSYVVNINEIDKVSAENVEIGNIEIPVSRLVKEELMATFSDTNT